MALNIQQIQENINNKADAREIINQIADFLQANQGGSGGSSYLVYDIFMFQTVSGSTTPSITEFVNTTDATFSITREGKGHYRITSSGAIFLANKIKVNNMTDWVGSVGVATPLYNSFGLVGYFFWLRDSNSTIDFYFYQATSFTTAMLEDIFVLIGTDKIPIEIRVYP